MHPGARVMIPSQGLARSQWSLGSSSAPRYLHTHPCTFPCTPCHIPQKQSQYCAEKEGEKMIFIFILLFCSGSSSLQNEMLTSAFAFPSCCVLLWVRPEMQYHQAWSSIYQCSQDWFVTLPVLGKWMSPSRSLPMQADLCFAQISYVM